MTGTDTASVQKAVAEVRAALESRLRTERASRRRVRVLAIAILCLIPLGALGPAENLYYVTAWFGLGIVLSLAALMLGWVEAANISGDIDKLHERVRALDRELASTQMILALARSGTPFTLFLRCFDAERWGLSRAGVADGELARDIAFEQWHRTGRGFIDPFNDTDAIPAARWQAELKLIRLIHAEWPVVLLGNTQLALDMRRELGELGVHELVVQAQDWWPLFAALAERAHAIVFLIEKTSSMLLREICHVVQQHLRYIVVGEERELEKLSAISDCGSAFLQHAISIIRYRDDAMGDERIDPAAVGQVLAQLRTRQ